MKKFCSIALAILLVIFSFNLAFAEELPSEMASMSAESSASAEPNEILATPEGLQCDGIDAARFD